MSSLPLLRVEKIPINANDSYYETSPAKYDFDSSHAHLAGLGIGLLATAAVSLSSTLTDIPVAGAEVVRLAFRLGVLVDDVSQNLQARELADGGPPDSWAYVLPNVASGEVQQELDAIHAKGVSQQPLSNSSELLYLLLLIHRKLPRPAKCLSAPTAKPLLP